MAIKQYQTTRPLLLEVDEETVSGALGQVTRWLGMVATVQSAFRTMLEDTVPNVNEPYLRRYLSKVILEAAREHEQRIGDLYAAFDQAPPATGLLGSVAGTVLDKTREVVGQAEGVTGGAHGSNRRTLRELLLTNLDAISGFAVAEQLGLALDRPAVVDSTFPIVDQKIEHQLFMREAFLEMAALAILYHRDL